MTRVFISGIAGFLGSNLASHYREAGWHVAGIDNLLGGDEHNIPAGTAYRIADCADRCAYQDLLKEGDLVFHCAAAPYEGLSVFSPALVYQHTLQSTVAMATASIAAGARRFVLCSSMARYGGGSPPFHEEDEPHPVDPYGWAKLGAEHALRNLCDIHGMEWATAVPHNIYGERQRFDDPFRNVIAIMINRMLRGEQPIVYGDGLQRRCFSYVGDVIDPLARLGDLPAAHGQVVNIGPDGEELSVLDLASALAGLLEFDLEPIFVPARPHEVRVANCCAQKARKLLGYHPRWSLQDGLLRTIAYIRRAGPRPFRYHLPIEIPSQQTPATWTEELI
jgi:UDP-glucose 4-epimerase